MVQWQKPENALQRANELLIVGKKMHALETLHEVINAPKHRTWSKTHEVIMGKHLELCVELRKPQMAKDALFQYRRICQQVNVKSLEDVILAFLEQAEKKAEEAKQESHGMVEEVAEDLDQAESPEKLLLAAVSGEGAQDRADRSVLSPWLRFLWESYRQSLELLRNNVQMELLYHKVARLAFQFCLKYQRKAEFRKLCDNLRTHLTQIQKSPQMHYNVKLSNPETIMLHQDTRLYQLDIAIQLESWQEAIRTTDDIQQLIYFSKRLLKPQSQATYYEKLASIFWKANNKLFHAAALLKLFQTFRDWKKNWVEKAGDEASSLATRVLLATLSVHWTGPESDLARHLDMEEAQVEHQRHLSNLLSLAVPPTRQGLLKELLRLNINFYAIKPVQELYRYLELEFCPLELSQKITSLMEVISEHGKPEFAQYLQPIKETAALKIMKQVSQIYKAISFDRMLSIIPFFDQFHLEKLIVFAGKRNLIQVRRDHRQDSIEFGAEESISPTSENDMPFGFQFDVPVIQPTQSFQICQFLQTMYSCLREMVWKTSPELEKALVGQLVHQISLQSYHAVDDHKEILERKKRIEAYKENSEKIKQELEENAKEEERRQAEMKRLAEQSRLEQENTERMETMRRKEQEELHRRMMQDRMERMKDPKFRRFLADLPEEEIQNLDNETLLQKQISHMEQEKREQLAKFKQQEKKWDHFVRALHMEEIPLRQQDYDDNVESIRQFWEEHELQRTEKAKEERKLLLENHARLQRIDEDAKQFLKQIREAKSAQMQKRFADWEKKMKDMRQKRLEERRQERKEKRRQAWLQEKAEEERAERARLAEEENKAKEDEYRSARDEMRGGGGRDYGFGKKPYERGYGQGGEEGYVPPFTRDKLGRQIEGSEPSEAMLSQLNEQNWRKAPPPVGAKTREPISGEPEMGRPFGMRRMVEGSGREELGPSPFRGGMRGSDEGPQIESTDWRSSLAARTREAPGLRDMGPRDMGLRDMGLRDMGPRDMGPRDMGLRDMGPPAGARGPPMSWRRQEGPPESISADRETIAPTVRERPFFDREEPQLRERPAFEEQRRQYMREREEMSPRERPSFEERRPFVREELPPRERPSFEDRRPYVREEGGGPPRERPLYEERRPYQKGEDMPPRGEGRYGGGYEERRMYRGEEPMITRERPPYDERRPYAREEPQRMKEPPMSWRRGPVPEPQAGPGLEDVASRGQPPVSGRIDGRPWSSARPWGRTGESGRGAPPPDMEQRGGPGRSMSPRRGMDYPDGEPGFAKRPPLKPQTSDRNVDDAYRSRLPPQW